MSEGNDLGNAVRVTIHDFVLVEFLPGEEPTLLTNGTPLITGGILDSIATVKLVSFLEDRFKVRFDTADVSVDKLDTIDRISETVLEMLNT